MRVVSRLGMKVEASAPMPSRGLIVANHLSYLDILFFSTLGPCVFVSKSEVRQWPLFGLLASCGGTIFVERGQGSVLASVAEKMRAAFAAGIPVVLFPEGTSTDGSHVLPFFPALFEAALGAREPIASAAIGYVASDVREADLCYYGDITFGPHLLTVLGKKGIRARIRFLPADVPYPDRRAAARQTRELVLRGRDELRQRAAGIE
ncbi:lysophospholipid acyltransferase family protein [Silvibacterium sp.]|uniref:lysophospholipid acyltransferase family protein n=1 Tax=Silvibacterium sp. TaxID=1964179 RepID=UPI0039E24208